MTRVPEQDLEAYQGDDWDEIADFALSSGDLTGAAMWLTVKRFPADADAAAVLQITSASGAIVITPPTTAAFSIPRAVLAPTVAPAGSYHYDVQVLLAGGKKRTALRGRFTIIPEITRA